MRSDFFEMMSEISTASPALLVYSIVKLMIAQFGLFNVKYVFVRELRY